MSLFSAISSDELTRMLTWQPVNDKIVFCLENGQILSLNRMKDATFVFTPVPAKRSGRITTRQLSKRLAAFHAPLCFRLADGGTLILQDLSRLGLPNAYGEPVHKMTFSKDHQ